MSATVAASSSSMSGRWRSAQPSDALVAAQHARRTRARSQRYKRPCFALGLVPQQPRAHHRRGGQRDHQRDQDRHRQRHGELAEQPPDDAAHQQDRDEHRDQRQAHRQHGEADLARARAAPPRSGVMPSSMWREMFSSTTIASSTTKPVAMVSAISDRLFEAVAAQVHDAEGADQRHRHRHARDQRGAPVAQEQEHHQDHQQRPRSAACARRRAARRGWWACGRAPRRGRSRAGSRRAATAAAPSRGRRSR